MWVILRRFSIITILAFTALFGSASFALIAQENNPTVNLQSELDIGFNCPVSSALNPDHTQLWILMDRCGGQSYSILIYDLASGNFIKIRNDDFAPFFENLTYEQWVNIFTTPFAYTQANTLEMIYSDGTQNYDTGRVVVPASGEGEAEANSILLTLETLGTLIPGYAGYPESTVYNHDHSLAAVIDTASIHIIDLLTGTELLVIDMPEGNDAYAYPVFSPDDQFLYLPKFTNSDDWTDYSAALTIYSLPDGAVTATYDVPTAFFWPSPDNRYLAGTIPDPTGDDSGDSLLIVTDLTTGNTSQSLPINEPPHRAVECMNDGRSLADLDFMLEGDLPIRSLIWLPDSSGFLTTNTYGGVSMGGGAACYLGYSRLRHYAVQSSN